MGRRHFFCREGAASTYRRAFADVGVRLQRRNHAIHQRINRRLAQMLPQMPVYDHQRAAYRDLSARRCLLWLISVRVAQPENADAEQSESASARPPPSPPCLIVSAFYSWISSPRNVFEAAESRVRSVTNKQRCKPQSYFAEYPRASMQAENPLLNVSICLSYSALAC